MLIPILKKSQRYERKRKICYRILTSNKKIIEKENKKMEFKESIITENNKLERNLS